MNNFEIPELPPTSGLQAQANYWCNVLGITPDQLNQMTDEEMEHRVQTFQKNYMRNAKAPDTRHAAYQTMTEQGGSPLPQTPTPRSRQRQSVNNTPREQQRTSRFDDPGKSARKAASKKAAMAKVQKQMEEEAALEAKERQEHYQQMQVMQQKQAFQKKQIRDKEIKEQQMQNEMNKKRQIHEEEMKRRHRQLKQDELLAAQQKQKNLDRQAAAKSPNRLRSPSPQFRRQSSPTRQQQKQKYEEEQRKLYEEEQRKLYEEEQQRKFYEEQQRQNQINEDMERQRYLKKLEAEKQKLYAKQQQRFQQKLEQRRLFEEQQRQILEDQLLSQQQQETEYQTDEVQSQEEGEMTEATEAEDVDTNENDYDEEGEGRLEGGMDSCDYEDEEDYDRQRGGECTGDMWGIFSNAADSIESRYGQPSGPRASTYPPGKATYRIKGIDVNKNTFDLNASYDGPSNQINYQNRLFKKRQDQCGGQDYIDYGEAEESYERGGQDYEVCEYNYDESSADDIDNDPDFDDEVGPSPRPNYLHMNPKVRTVSSYQVEYSEDGVDESEQNVTVENDGNKQKLKIQSRSFLAGLPPVFDDCPSDYEDRLCPYGDDLGGTIQRNVRSDACGRTVELTKVTNQRDGMVRKAHHSSRTDGSGRTRKTANVDIVPRY